MFTDNAFSNAIKDPSTYRQNIVLAFANGYFSGNDGDIEQSGVVFDEYFCTAEDLTYGECTSAMMEASLINDNQVLRSFQWGECEAYIGYLSATESVSATDGVNATFVSGENTFTADTEGFKVNGTVIHSGECYTLLFVRGHKLPISSTLYAFGDGYAYRVPMSDPTPELMSTNRFMVGKMKKRGLIEWMPTYPMTVFNAYVTANGTKQTWRYAPMGIYNVEKPKNLSGDVVEIDNAFDRMRLFDVDASEFLAYMDKKYPTALGLYPTANGWRQELCDWVGISREAQTISLGGDKYSPNTAQTLREILAYVADALKCNFYFNRMGELAQRRVGDTLTEEVEIRRIEHSTLAMAEYVTRPIKKVVNRNLSGLTYITGNGDNAYYIYGNPFISDNSNLSLSDYAWGSYAPMSCVVLEADPLVDVGDEVGIWLTDEDFRIFVDEYNRAFTDENSKLLGEETVPVGIPLMHRTLAWNGVCTATYEATGNRTRIVPSMMEQTSYNANIANDTENVINKIIAHGIEADWIKTGKLESPNGEYSLDMETGTVNMANANITGGVINMQTDNSTENKFVLNLDNDGWTYQIWINPAGINATTKAKLVGATGTAWYGGGASWQNVWDSDGSGTRYEVGNGGFYIFTRESFASSWVRRAKLTENGLEFYDSNGNLTKSYSAT